MLPDQVKVGTKVRVKAVEQMTDIWGTLKNVPAVFDKTMLHLCGREGLILSFTRRDDGWVSIDTNIKSASNYYITCAMLECVDPAEAAREAAYYANQTIRERVESNRIFGCQSKYVVNIIDAIKEASART